MKTTMYFKRIFAVVLAFLMTATAFILTIPQAEAALSSVEGGMYAIIAGGGAQRLAADAANNGSTNGTNLQLYEFNATNAQIWDVVPQGNGYYSIRKHGTNLCWDIEGGVARDGTNVILYQYKGVANQLWKFIPAGDGYFEIRSAIGYNVNVSGGCFASGTNLWSYHHDGTKAEKFHFMPVAPGTVRTSSASSRLNLRSQPNTNSAIVAKLNYGTPVLILAKSGDFYLLNINNTIGYAAKQYISFNTSTSNQPPAATASNDFRMPMNNAYCTWSSPGSNMSWGARNGSSNGRSYHLGIDIYGTNGSVLATASGTVVASGWNDANGNFIVLSHSLNGRTVYSFYAHLASRSVNKGAAVSCGQKIGVAGKTGSSARGTHLHFAITNSLSSSGSYYGYATKFSGNSVPYSGKTFYNPLYVINNDRLP